jgi:hypothetical protein
VKLIPSIGAILLAALSALGTTQAQASTPSLVADLQSSSRPAGVPLDYVITPNGFFHPACVVELADDDVLARSGEVTHADGRITPATVCRFASFDAEGHERLATESAGGVADATVPPPTINGWLVNSNAAAVPAARTTATFVVPSAPVSSSGQVLYYFPGLEALSNTQSILQPVLAWNGFGDNAWTMTNWNCCINGTTYHGGTIASHTGDKIVGTMKGTNCNGSTGVCTNWQITSTDKNTGQKTTFKTLAYGQAMNWYFGGVLEVYGVNTCSQFPSNGSITFSAIHFYDLNNAESTPGTWTKSIGNVSPSCSYGITATANKTVITWKAQ